MRLGVVDVGGGLRGIYATAVLDYCLDAGIHFDCCIGVSAGSANLASFLSRQRGRNFAFYTDYARRRENMGLVNFFKTGSYINMDYLYGKLSNADGEAPLDYETFTSNPAELIVVAENARTGECRYFNKNDIRRNDYRVLMASCSVPAVNKPYIIDGVPYFDGALADPVPVEKAFEMGCDRVVVILTRPADIPCRSVGEPVAARLIRSSYPVSAQRLYERAEKYNSSVEAAKRYAQEGRVCIVAPESIRGATTFSGKLNSLKALYERGERDARSITAWL